MAVEPQAKVEIYVSEQDSCGTPGISIPISRRLMALSADENVWYGFILSEADSDILEVGRRTRAKLAFLNDTGAKDAFKSKQEVPFGNGLQVQGTLKLEWI